MSRPADTDPRLETQTAALEAFMNAHSTRTQLRQLGFPYAVRTVPSNSPSFTPGVHLTVAASTVFPGLKGVIVTSVKDVCADM